MFLIVPGAFRQMERVGRRRISHVIDSQGGLVGIRGTDFGADRDTVVAQERQPTNEQAPTVKGTK
jgi:hypothetical protein